MSRIIAQAGALVGADKAITHRLARHRDHPLVRALGWGTELADQPPLIALSVATIAIGAVGGRRDLMRGGARMLAAELLATTGKSAIKALVDRSRPRHALATGDARFGRGDSDDHELNSFPSGHTAGAVAVSLAAAREIDGVGLPAAVAAGIVAVSQAPTGHHYISDVAAGAAIGWLAEALVDAMFSYLDEAAPTSGPGRGSGPAPGPAPAR